MRLSATKKPHWGAGERMKLLIRLRAMLAPSLELTFIVCIALVFTAPLLDFKQDTVPIGREYASSIHAFHFWTRLRDCGQCALWNGSIQGGYPALAELHAGILHPLPAALVLFLGVPIGMKVATAVSILLAGLALWWVAHGLGIGRGPRLWAALSGLVAGNLSGRMEAGMVNLLLSTSACTLAVAAGLHLALRPRRPRAMLFGLLLAAALLSGQVYVQVGLLLWLPLLPLFARPRLRWPLVRELGPALLVAALLTAPLWLPLAHFLPAIGKPSDLPLLSPQPFRWTALNLLIDDPHLYFSRTLGMINAPSIYHNYVGWLTVGLALVGASAGGAAHPDSMRRGRFLAVSIVWLLLLASREPWHLLQRLITTGPAASGLAAFRNPSVIAGLAAPFLILLAAQGLGLLWQRPPWPWPRDASGGPFAGVSSWRAILVLGLGIALFDTAQYHRGWLATMPQPKDLAEVLAHLTTEEAAWVSTPYAEDLYTEPAIRSGMKLADAWQPWFWRDRPPPQARRIVRRLTDLEGIPGTAHVTVERGGFRFLADPSPLAAYVTVTSRNRVPLHCAAKAQGGDIELRCPGRGGGILMVQEHAWPGWKASVDGVPVSLLPSPWLKMVLPAGGSGLVTLRFRPFDAVHALALALLGALLTVAQLRRRAS